MARELLQMAGPQQVVDVDEGRLGQRAQRLALDHQHVPAQSFSTLTPPTSSLR